jgi:hypothetical protein
VARGNPPPQGGGCQTHIFYFLKNKNKNKILVFIFIF